MHSFTQTLHIIFTVSIYSLTTTTTITWPLHILQQQSKGIFQRTYVVQLFPFCTMLWKITFFNNLGGKVTCCWLNRVSMVKTQVLCKLCKCTIITYRYGGQNCRKKKTQVEKNLIYLYVEQKKLGSKALKTDKGENSFLNSKI